MRSNLLKFIVFLNLISLFSCEKEESFPRILKKSRFENGEVHFYTKDGKITDNSEINDYIDFISNDFYSIFHTKPSLDSNIVDYNKSDFTIEFITKSKARFILGNGKIREFDIIRNKDVIFFVQDSLVKDTYNVAYDTWSKFKPDIVKTESTFYGQISYYKPTLFAYEINNEIQFPILSLMGVYMDTYGNYLQIFYRNKNTSINDDLLERISKGTYPLEKIVYRESRIIFSAN